MREIKIYGNKKQKTLTIKVYENQKIMAKYRTIKLNELLFDLFTKKAAKMDYNHLIDSPLTRLVKIYNMDYIVTKN